MEELKKYSGNKNSRLKAMLSIGVMATSLMLSVGITKDAEAAGMYANNPVPISKKEQAKHNQYVKNNFVKKKIMVEVHPGVPRAGIPPKYEEKEVLVPTKEHQQRILQSIEQYEQTMLKHRVDELEKHQRMSNPFIENLKVPNYSTPNHNNRINSDVRIHNSRISGNVKIGQIYNDCER